MKKFKVGLQLFGLHSIMHDDFEGTLKAVKEMGYDYVEFASYYGNISEEVKYGDTTKETKAILDKYNLKVISTHQSADSLEQEETIKTLKNLGITRCAIPWYSNDEYRNNWDKTIKRFEKISRDLKAEGITLMYHNHASEFEKIGDEYILDKLYNDITPDILMPQLDLCWVAYPGEDPVKYLKRYSGKMDTVHFKDFCVGKNDKGEPCCQNMPLGEGILDWKSIIEAADMADIEYIIVENEPPKERNALDDARISREFLKTLGI